MNSINYKNALLREVERASETFAMDVLHKVVTYVCSTAVNNPAITSVMTEKQIDAAKLMCKVVAMPALGHVLTKEWLKTVLGGEAQATSYIKNLSKKIRENPQRWSELFDVLEERIQEKGASSPAEILKMISD
jgi:galactose-1-phosphate uridylyltransferase